MALWVTLLVSTIVLVGVWAISESPRAADRAGGRATDRASGHGGDGVGHRDRPAMKTGSHRGAAPARPRPTPPVAPTVPAATPDPTVTVTVPAAPARLPAYVSRFERRLRATLGAAYDAGTALSPGYFATADGTLSCSLVEPAYDVACLRTSETRPFLQGAGCSFPRMSWGHLVIEGPQVHSVCRLDEAIVDRAERLTDGSVVLSDQVGCLVEATRVACMDLDSGRAFDMRPHGEVTHR